MLKKVKGLFVPYILWVVIATILSVPLTCASNILAGRPLYMYTVFEESGAFNFLNRTFAILQSGPMHLGALWYVRALIILFIMAPVWRFFCRKQFAWMFAILWAWMFWFAPNINFHGFQLELTRTSFFFLGMFISVYAQRFLTVNSHIVVRGKQPSFLSFSFWLYCTHTIILSYILAAGHVVLGRSDIAIAFLTPTSAILTIFVSVFSAQCVKLKFPVVYHWLNGGR